MTRRIADGIGALNAPLARQAGIYTASNILSRVAPFLLLPILTRYLSPADYGTVAMFALVASLIEPFVGLGLPGAISVRFYDKGVDLPLFIGTGLRVIAVGSVIAMCALVALGGPLASLTQVPAIWLVLVAPLVMARSVVGSFTSLLRVRELAIWFGVVQNAQTLIAVGLALLLVVVLSLGWPGRVVADVLTNATFAVIAIVWLLRRSQVRWGWSSVYARQLLRFGVPLIPHLIGSALIVQTDRLLLTNMVGITETGLYTVAFQLVLIIEVVAVSFNNAYAPWLFRKLSQKSAETNGELVKLTYRQFAAMGALAALVAIAAPWLATALLDSRYGGASIYVVWLALGLFFSAAYYMVANYIFYAQKTEVLAGITIATAVANIPVTIILIQANGGVGAAQASAIAYAAAFGLTWLVSNRVYPMPWLKWLRPLRRRP